MRYLRSIITTKRQLMGHTVIDKPEWNNTDQELKISIIGGFPGGAVVENPPANAGDTGSSPGLGRSHMLRSN